MSVKIDGMDELLEALKEIGEEAPKVAGAALYEHGQNIMVDSVEMAPLGETGALRGGAYCTLPDDEGGVEIGYGGPAGPYLVRQHEDTTLKHKVGEHHFLTKAVQKHAGNLTRTLARAIDTFMRTKKPPPLVSKGIKAQP